MRYAPLAAGRLPRRWLPPAGAIATPNLFHPSVLARSNWAVLGGWKRLVGHTVLMAGG